MTKLAFAMGVALCLTHTCGPARAGEADLSPELVCSVQKALRSGPAWPARKCVRVADAFNRTGRPVTIASIAVNESDMRDHAIAWHGPHVADVGLMGIRCHLGPDRRCTNGPARGLTIAQLMRAETSIRVGAAILASKANVGHYNAKGKRGRAYAAKIATLAEAFGGVEVRVKGKRVRELVRRIVAARKLERKS